MDLFDFNQNTKTNAPLADRMRPRNIDEFIGQSEILGKGTLLYKLIKEGNVPSVILYGPPGVGKTSIATIIAKDGHSDFFKLNAVSSGVAEAKEVIAKAKDNLRIYGRRTYLLLDECHRWSKSQSDCILQAVEEGIITFIGSTTENPYVSITRALLSRCKVFKFKRLDFKEMKIAIDRALKDKERGFGKLSINIDDEAVDALINIANGDLRKLYNYLELAVNFSKYDQNADIAINLESIKSLVLDKSYVMNESMYYDMISAFIKSMRGSSSEGALYWVVRMIEGGCDPMLIARRIIIHAAEDVGIADPNALPIAVAAMNALEKIGLPEAMIPLSEAIIYISEAPKSNSVVVALEKAKEAVAKIKNEEVPFHLRDNLNKFGKGLEYLYPHNYPNGYVKQQYLPTELMGSTFYFPKEAGFEKEIIKRKKERED